MYFVPVFVVLVALHTSQNFVGTSPVPDNEVLYNANDVPEYCMPVSCRDKPYCFDKGDAYPDSTVEKLVNNINLSDMQLTPNTPKIIVDRDGPGPGNAPKEPDCRANSTMNPVFYITDDSGVVRVVLQSKNFTQIYNMEWCQNEGRIPSNDWQALRHYSAKTLEDFHFECVTTRLLVDFFVLNEEDPSDPKMEIVVVKIPVCCRCRIKAEAEKK